MSNKRSGKERSQRQMRVDEQIKRMVVEYLQREYFEDEALSDPSSITISLVQTSPDLRSATAFIMPFGGDNADEIVRALNEETKGFNHYIAKNLTTKNTPKIKFAVDKSFDENDKITALLKGL